MLSMIFSAPCRVLIDCGTVPPGLDVCKRQLKVISGKDGDEAVISDSLYEVFVQSLGQIDAVVLSVNVTIS